MIFRTLEPLVLKVLREWGKMVLLSGPRQVGKTTLAQDVRQKYAHDAYISWDNLEDQRKIAKTPYFFKDQPARPGEKCLLVFDEIHKYTRWKNYLKGAFDSYHADYDFLVTGSGRLDLYKRGKDSLFGRYFSLKLFPLTVGELLGRMPKPGEFFSGLPNPPAPTAEAQNACDQLWRFGGFPDPFLKADAVFYRLWRDERKQLVLRDDVLQIVQVRELSQLQILTHLLPERVGGLLSINALRQEVGVAFETVRDWLKLLEHVYYSFRLFPFSGKIHRALRKEAKIYLYDWAELENEPARFENMAALHLLKAVSAWNLVDENDWSLHYVRDKEKREVDFAVVKNKKPVLLVETKLSETTLAPSLLYYQEKFDIPVAIQLVHRPGVFLRRRENNRVQWIISAAHWLSLLP